MASQIQDEPWPNIFKSNKKTGLENKGKKREATD